MLVPALEERVDHVLSELPDLDESVSFIVDNGASVGPIPMREIVASIRLGEREPSSLVWWAGATDWTRFDSNANLLALVEHQQDPIAEPLASAPPAGDDTRWGVPATAAAEPVDEPVEEPVEVAPIAETPMALDESQEAQPAIAESEIVEPESEIIEPVVAEPVTAEVPSELPIRPTAEPVGAEVSSELPIRPTGQLEQPEAAEQAEAAEHADSVDDEEARPAITGLFSAGARTQPAETPDADPQEPSPDALDAILAARVSLESVGARIEALSSATKRSASPEELHAPGAETPAVETPAFENPAFDDPVDEAPVVEPTVVEVADESATADPFSVNAFATNAFGDPQPSENAAFAPEPADDDGLAESSFAVALEAEHQEHSAVSEETAAEAVSAGSWTEVDGESAEQTAAEQPESGDASDARVELSARFEEMVRKSVAHQRQIEWIMRVDELLLSACITAIADAGFVAMDLNSRESEHRVLFSHNDDSRQVRLDLAPVTSVGDHLGRHVRFGLSWGRDVENADTAFEIVRGQSSDLPTPPGVLTCEADVATSSVSTHVDLILAADDFVKDDYSVDRASLDTAIAATLDALEKHWTSLFGDV